MTNLSATPIGQYVYGDIESCALTIDVFSDGEEPYQARAWEDGATTDLGYFSSFEACIEWFSKFDSPLPHSGTEEETPAAVGIAPQSGDLGRTIVWTLIDDNHVDSWWDGSDFPDGHIGDARIILFSEMVEEPSTKLSI